MTGGFGNFGETAFSNIPVEGFKTDSAGYEIYPDWVTNGISLDDYSNSSGGFNLGSLPWSKILGTAGRLGSGLLTGAATAQTQQQPDYMFLPQYSGNGLATTRVINNKANKQNQLDQMFGAGNMLSQLFPNGFGIFGNSNLNTNLGANNRTTSYDDYGYLNPTGVK